MVNIASSATKKSQIGIVVILLIVVLTVILTRSMPTASANPVSCSTDYYSNALRTSCTDGSSSVCYNSGHCTYQSAADRQRGVSAYEELLRGAGFCNVIRCVK